LRLGGKHGAFLNSLAPPSE